ncbi:MAG: GNAT family N-acetyltransferase [Desulfobacterales bacterium]
MRAFFPAQRLERFEDFYSSRIDNSLLLDALGVDASHRRQGIGTRLVELTKEMAQKNGYELISLIVFADNAAALALYKFLGFEAVQEIKLEGNEFIPHRGGCVLLRCKATT